MSKPNYLSFIVPTSYFNLGLGGRNRTCVDLFPKQAGGLYPTPRKIYEGGARNEEKDSSFIAQASAFQSGGIGGTRTHNCWFAKPVPSQFGYDPE
jgi:hypothetical protein